MRTYIVILETVTEAMSTEGLFALYTAHGMSYEARAKRALELVKVALDNFYILNPIKPVPDPLLLMWCTPISLNLITIMRL